MSQPPVQLQQPPPPPPPHPHSPNSTVVAAVSEVGHMFKRLDPNMLAVLLLTVILNGMFFWVYMQIAHTAHIEFMAALNSCPVQRGGAFIPSMPGGMDR